jgi:hypothetical protein
MTEVTEHSTAIRTPDQRLRVFVSSTLGELATNALLFRGPCRRSGSLR